ncbi:similar to Saccharomyces cerevisiae YPL009C TAE2 Protein of unknown function, involved in protein translation [Maudiozyma barnettii]|uniref:Ribosome quality control complex subunit 2 n=1 Tax=Maudiozyma barnettii TaxID=61262 RepID=A0A8H2VBY6_9SACH|nr:Rqc2p [Kazachstania barnettii]CAB4252451.1 similar to Saccharomyces cerevisiae YPL009C TAE2 Protein of unknown function, involved in protein translation [Kazachstania barnettii]CAD1779186.1 similar to Saccharomyces cerevisiae YPL009C TAE2 Protein of unknown function, involved in protein translation [Kazachstania barnettii]
MKQRISGLDLKLLAKELKESLVSYRLTNIYNVADSSKQFLLKFGKPDSKLNVVVDSGSKIHTTTFTRHTPEAPSGFVSKLRKHLKSKRLTALRQIPNDRILVFQFADGLYYLVLEFFSAGNVMLLDENQNILSLQRIVSEHENKVGEKYEMFDSSLFHSETTEDIETVQFSTELVSSWLKEIEEEQNITSSITTVTSEKKKKKKVSIHKLLLRKQPQLSSDLLSNNLKKTGIEPSTRCLEFLGKEQEISTLLTETQDEYIQLIKEKERCGYIVAQKNKNFDSEKHDQELEFIYENFHPFKPFIEEKELDKFRVIEIAGEYNRTVDTFFSTIESNKLALRIQSQEAQAQKRIDDARSANEMKIKALTDIQSSNEHKAELIINNADLVEQAKAAVQNLIDQQTDWSTIEKLIQSEQKKGNKIAKMIEVPLMLKKNKINVRLPLENTLDESSVAIYDRELSDSSDSSDSSESSDSSDSSDSDSDSDSSSHRNTKKSKIRRKIKSTTAQTATVTIDLGLSAYANASQYFTVKKTGAEKQKKVEKNLEKAMKNIEVKIDQQLKKKMKETHKVLKKIRTPYFFEKYNWFISSEGFLVLHGKSPLETDQIYSRFIEDKDVFMSNNFNTHVWIKNPDKTEIPPNTLMQAGVFCMSTSAAWSKKVSSSAWWCYAENVSKFDDHDGVLPSGVYRIKRELEKNELSPSQLIMGIAFLWKIRSDESVPDADDGVTSVPGLDETVNPTKKTDLDNEIPSKIKEENILSLTEMDVENANDFSNLTPNESEFALPKEGELTSIPREENDTKTIATTTISKMSKGVRGKKGKLKKMQRKYADQDDEERLMRLDVLGTLKGIERQEEKERTETLKQEEREYKKAQREKQIEKQVLQFSSNEKVHANYHNFKDQLKPSLTYGDDVVDVIPVFAPWSALLKYKYKVKIQPGSAKKTKSMTEVLRYFMGRNIDNKSEDKETDWPIEHKLIKSINESDLIPLLCVDKLNLSLPNSNKTKTNSKGAPKKQKSGKKSKKRM